MGDRLHLTEGELMLASALLGFEVTHSERRIDVQAEDSVGAVCQERQTNRECRAGEK